MGKQKFWKTKKQVTWPHFEIQTVFSSLLMTLDSQNVYNIGGGINGQ
jgi:hypothetical protein